MRSFVVELASVEIIVNDNDVILDADVVFALKLKN
jgi:hypothetical protein